jgi:hypothetical protein
MKRDDESFGADPKVGAQYSSSNHRKVVIHGFDA